MSRNLWIIPAKPDEQGSFCDLESQIHYTNVSQTEAVAEEETAMYRGDGIVPTQDDPSEYPKDQRFNLTQTEVDSVGYDYPAKYAPGR